MRLGRVRDVQPPVQRGDAAAPLSRRALRRRARPRSGRASARARPPADRGRVLSRARAGRPHRHSRHAQPPLPALRRTPWVCPDPVAARAPSPSRMPKLGRPGRMRGVDYAGFVMDGTGWRNASLSECLPSSGWRDLEDVTEEAGLRLEFLPRHRALAHPPERPPRLRPRLWRASPTGAVAIAGSAVPQPPPQKAESRDPSSDAAPR